MKKTCETREPIASRVIPRGSRQVVESAIDASKSSRTRSWEASANIARRKRRAARKEATGEEDE